MTRYEMIVISIWILALKTREITINNKFIIKWNEYRKK